MFAGLRRFLLINILLITGLLSFSQQKWPASLLWRISGNGLQKPSYLYGTLHVQDKRVFNFTDSLYRAIENTEGLALEVNFHDYLDTLLSNLVEQKEDELIAKMREEKIDIKSLDRSADSIVKKLGYNDSSLTKKQLKKIRDLRLQKIVAEGDMPTIMDAFLYSLAMRQQKWVGGIEDIHDQMDIMDETGKNLDVKEVFVPESQLRQSLDKLIKLYINEDLEGIGKYCYTDDTQYDDRLLIRRNIKMARRMDSLSALRPMFFAVGAAHLPGDSGVISFLRDKGFTVEPVFSQKRIPATSYASHLQQVAWTTVKGENNLYTVEMPGEPSQYNMFGEIVRMKMYFDLSTMTAYLSGSSLGSNKTEKELHEMLESIANNGGPQTGKIYSSKILHLDSLTGIEGVVENKDGFYRVQVLQKDNAVFILMAVSNKKENLGTADVDHFLNSFHANNNSLQKEWIRFELPEKALSVSLPATPKRNKTFERQADGSNWNLTAYDFLDINNGLYFIIGVKDIAEGYYLSGDSSYFELVRQSFSGRVDEVSRNEVSSFHGYPALWYNGYSKKENLILRTINVVRGNRVYNIVVVGTMKSDSSLVDQFFNSIEIIPYKPTVWSKQYCAGFSTMAPVSFKKMPSDSTLLDQEHYLAYDTTRVISYQVYKQPISPLYWTNNDSLYLEKIIANYSPRTDSVLQKRFCYNGSSKGMETLVEIPGNNNLRRVRVFLNGDTLYTIIAYIPREYISQKEEGLFFSDFSLATEKPTSIFTNKADLLISALQTTDSIEFNKAVKVFSNIAFEKSDLPQLHKALLHKYRDFDKNYSFYDQLLDTVVNLADSTTIDFIERNYSDLKNENEELKGPWLTLLARMKTEASFRALKKLWLQPLPENLYSGALTGALKDSVLLTRIIFPELIENSRDSIKLGILIPVINDLIDSNLIELKQVLPFESYFLEQAQRKIRLLQDSTLDGWSQTYLVDLIGLFHDQKANSLLQKFLRLPQIPVKQSAIMALAKNNQPVDAKQIGIVASQKDSRLDLYNSLKDIKKENLFPTNLANQRSFGECELYMIASDDYEVSDISFIGEKIANYEGAKQKFYLYKISFGEGNGSYLGITGPYPLNAKKLLTSTNAASIYWDDTYEPSKLQKQFHALLDQMNSSPEDMNRK